MHPRRAPHLRDGRGASIALTKPIVRFPPGLIGHRNGEQRDLGPRLILAIDAALRNAPPRGTTMPTDAHVDALLDLRLAVHELMALAPLDADVESTHRSRRRVVLGQEARPVLEPSSGGAVGSL